MAKKRRSPLECLKEKSKYEKMNIHRPGITYYPFLTEHHMNPPLFCALSPEAFLLTLEV
jgi:hypothetical protein